MYKIQRMAKKDAMEEEASHQNPKDGQNLTDVSGSRQQPTNP